MPAKFPKWRGDGTFSIELLLSMAEPPPGEILDIWLHEWSQRNGTWVRSWQGAAGKIVAKDTLQLLEAFQREPYRVASSEPFMVIRLDGTTSAPFWKDWLARLVKEVTAEFPGLTFVKARDVEDEAKESA